MMMIPLPTHSAATRCGRGDRGSGCGGGTSTSAGGENGGSTAGGDEVAGRARVVIELL
jgi:hypothetical protein